MLRHVIRAIPIAVALPAVGLAFAAIAASPTSSRATTTPDLDDPRIVAVRKATERYRDARVAIADGYVDERLCVAMPGEGAMGVHFIHPKRMGMVMENGRIHGTDTRIDPAQPEILVYEPQPDGSLTLVAVEWYVSQAAWGARPHPTIFGVPFNTMQDDPATPDVDEGHAFTPHYDLHLWLYRENPRGAFAQWNPRVSCPATGDRTAHPAH